jgi:hypothetical protein
MPLPWPHSGYRNSPNCAATVPQYAQIKNANKNKQKIFPIMLPIRSSTGCSFSGVVMAEIPVCIAPFDNETSSPREQDGYARTPLPAALDCRVSARRRRIGDANIVR